MYGRPLCSDEEAERRGFRGPEAAQRRRVLRQTIEAFETAQPPDRFHRLASENLHRWAQSGVPSDGELRLEVLRGDWGDVTLELTRTHGVCFAVLNMANAYVPGGAYVEGAVAQEENVFRRTDCHFHVSPEEYDRHLDRYRPAVTALISADRGRVYLDTDRPRVCIRGPEDRSRADLGYQWLPDHKIFPFFELRAAAQDLRNGSAFDVEDGRQRIAAQLDTVCDAGLRHVVLGASGCGAFRNPAHEVAAIYREEIERRRTDLAVVAFAIFAAGYGPSNYEPFARILDRAGRWGAHG